jgi:NTE family protein
VSGALVLSGGGLAGIAWEVGVLAGIAEESAEVFTSLTRPETTYLGTSAGSAVASQLAGGTPIEELYAQQVAEETAELGAQIDSVAFGEQLAKLLEGVASPEEARRRIGAFARAADTGSASARRAVIEARLSVTEWPDRRLLITAVDTDSGELRVFDRDSGVSLVDAVSASCAVPGVWPTVEIDGRHYTDGGVRSTSNVDLVAGSDPILVLTPAPELGPLGPTIAPEQLAALGIGARSLVFADEASLIAFGSNPLDPAVRPGAAIAGREQGRRLAPELLAIWA